MYIDRALTLVVVLCVLCAEASALSTLDRAQPYLRKLLVIVDANWAEAPLKQVVAGKIEQESSWREQATLKTSRELGRGLAQLTIAYDKAGKERFNTYREAVKLKQLAGWNWERDPYNVTYQLTYSVLTDKRNFKAVRPYAIDDAQAWKGALVCYNAGYGRWLQRRHNAKAMGLDATSWDKGLSLAHGVNENTALYGAPLWKAVNAYPVNIFGRAEKYAQVDWSK